MGGIAQRPAKLPNRHFIETNPWQM
jgi:hypothetical protein